VAEEEQRYGIDVQVNDLMDELLSTIPNAQRTKAVLDNIHILIERFKELRSQYSLFDINQNVYDVKTVGVLHKPLIHHLQSMDAKLKWIIPIVSNRRKIYNNQDTRSAIDVSDKKIENDIKEIETAQKSTELDYQGVNNIVNEIMTPFDEPINKTNLIGTANLLENIDSIVDNLEDFYSTV
jgi:hypothetical protein